jgi:hypothetical protein
MVNAPGKGCAWSSLTSRPCCYLLRAHALSRLVTFRTSYFGRVEKCEGIAFKPFAHDGHDIP